MDGVTVKNARTEMKCQPRPSFELSAKIASVPNNPVTGVGFSSIRSNTVQVPPSGIQNPEQGNERITYTFHLRIITVSYTVRLS